MRDKERERERERNRNKEIVIEKESSCKLACNLQRLIDRVSIQDNHHQLSYYHLRSTIP